MALEFAPKFPFIFRSDVHFAEKLPADQRATIFNNLMQMYRIAPQNLPGATTIQGIDNALCLYHFVSDTFRKYSGMEMVLLNRENVTYHRMPGALADGEGEVAAGDYTLKIKPFNQNQEVLLKVTKTAEGKLQAPEVITQVANNSEVHERPCRIFSYSHFLSEYLATQQHWLKQLTK